MRNISAKVFQSAIGLLVELGGFEVEQSVVKGFDSGLRPLLPRRCGPIMEFMKFEWNKAKNQTNKAKHGLDFADAEQVFAGHTVTLPDHRCDYGEERFITLGELNGRVIVVVHTQQGGTTRIISMRKANKREQGYYS